MRSLFAALICFALVFYAACEFASLLRDYDRQREEQRSLLELHDWGVRSQAAAIRSEADYERMP
ncbi:hypothetical protein [Limnoglobus roseus]|uniref:Uncharacterized protein n=1 Tax=Limnoglobus roseus TaxID=2598579 RepID=A0A5C1AP50_9BACT|nr:hypothetical protein [Limnoglobus roseus]QEL20941.1 hypothetical protein PX52LOC_08069 [Limnoglobus roseus]